MAITTADEVRIVGHITDEYTDEEILTEIDVIESQLYEKYSLPKRSSFSTDKTTYGKIYYFSRVPVHEVIRIQVSVDISVDPTGYTSLTEGVDFIHLSPDKYVEFSDTFINQYPTSLIRVQYIPKLYNLLAKNLTAYNLVNITNIIKNTSVNTPEGEKIKSRIDMYKDMIKPKGITKSSISETFDKYEYESVSQTELR